jgi:hypothetical protein
MSSAFEAKRPWLHLGWIHPVHFEQAYSMHPQNQVALRHSEVPHFFWHQLEVAKIHCL